VGRNDHRCILVRPWGSDYFTGCQVSDSLSPTSCPKVEVCVETLLSLERDARLLVSISVRMVVGEALSQRQVFFSSLFAADTALYWVSKPYCGSVCISFLQ
jgi:hypothetical protein